MSKWSDIENPIEASVALEAASAEKETASASKELSFTSMVPITIDTVDGRRVNAFVHQGTRSVYPKLEQ